jgi:hypothetical protein
MDARSVEDCQGSAAFEMLIAWHALRSEALAPRLS